LDIETKSPLKLLLTGLLPASLVKLALPPSTPFPQSLKTFRLEVVLVVANSHTKLHLRAGEASHATSNIRLYSHVRFTAPLTSLQGIRRNAAILFRALISGSPTTTSLKLFVSQAAIVGIRHKVEDIQTKSCGNTIVPPQRQRKGATNLKIKGAGIVVSNWKRTIFGVYSLIV
jgi:hypothetical protein